jgi:hypothetical protein
VDENFGHQGFRLAPGFAGAFFAAFRAGFASAAAPARSFVIDVP